MSPLLLIPLVYLAAALDPLLSARWQIAGVVPDLLALTAFAYLATSQNRYSFVIAAFIGLVSDLNSPAPLGSGMASFAIMAFLLVQLQSRVDLDHLPGRIAIVGLGAAGVCLLQSITLRILGEISLPVFMLPPRSILVGLYTAGVSLPILMLVTWFQSPHQTLELTAASIPRRN